MAKHGAIDFFNITTSKYRCDRVTSNYSIAHLWTLHISWLGYIAASSHRNLFFFRTLNFSSRGIYIRHSGITEYIMLFRIFMTKDIGKTFKGILRKTSAVSLPLLELLMTALLHSFVVHSTRYNQREYQHRFFGLFKRPQKTLFLCTSGVPGVCAHVDPYDHFAFFHHHSFDQPVILTLFVTFVSYLALYQLLDSRIQDWVKLKLRKIAPKLRKVS